MAHFLIAGLLVDTDAERQAVEDVTPSQLRSFLNGLDDGEPLTLDITSYGGSVTAGLAMLGLLRQASADGHHTTAHIIGIAASMASALACGCEDLTIDSNAFVMVHLPWTSTTGNAVDLRKEADTLDLYRDSLVAVYRTKFDLPDSVIVKMLEDETWFLGA